MKSSLIIFFIPFILFIVFITTIFMFLSLHKENDTTKEGFLSGFRQMYRPYVRRARLYTTSNYDSLSGKVAVFLRRWGLW
jgi:hypothetical protein